MKKEHTKEITGPLADACKGFAAFVNSQGSTGLYDKPKRVKKWKSSVYIRKSKVKASKGEG